MTTLGIGFSEAITLTQPVRQAALNQVRSLGATTVRCEVPWNSITNEQAWKTYVDPLFADLSAAGLDPLVVIAHPPSGATPASLGLFVTALLKRQPMIKAIEVYNEMNLANFGPTDAKVYTPFLIAAHKAIKDAKPSCVVVLGGLAACATASSWFIPTWPFFRPWQNYSPDTYLKAIHAAGGEKSYDVLGYHPYALADSFAPQAPSVAQKYIAMIDTLAPIANRPIWATEFGFSLANWSAAQQAAYLADELRILKGKSCIERIYAYALHDVNGERFGLFDAGGAARPAAAEFTKALT